VAELAARPELVAIIGPLISGDAAAAAVLAGQARIPLLLLAPREGTTGGYVFRNALTVAAQVRALADFARGEGLQRFAILHAAARHDVLYADQFQAAVERQGGQVVARQSYPPGAVDLRQQLQALAAEARRRGNGPLDALFLPDEARQVAQIIPQLGFSRLDLLQLLGTNAWNNPELGRMAGPLSEGAVFVDGFFAGSPWPEVSDFVARFQSAYGSSPNILSAQGYDAGHMLLTLLARPGVTDRESFRQALAALRDFPGVTGRTSFGPDGEAEKVLFLLQVQDGTVVQIN
jgi:ABC-type branched-subunit amino acid transport system substrate-binding protein